ncbi:MAG: hypothetical protein ABSG91_18765, partial [Syntrophobacteraceae bacterium]
ISITDYFFLNQYVLIPEENECSSDSIILRALVAIKYRAPSHLGQYGAGDRSDAGNFAGEDATSFCESLESWEIELQPGGKWEGGLARLQSRCNVNPE